MLFYMHQQQMVPDYVPNMNKINPFFSEMSQQIHKMYEQVAIITEIWHRARCYFTSMSNRWYMYLITVPNLNKITTFFSDISQQTLKIYEKMAIITQSCHRAKFYFT